MAAISWKWIVSTVDFLATCLLRFRNLVFICKIFILSRNLAMIFFFVHLSRNRRHRFSVVFVWSSCKTSAKSDVRNFVKNNFCFASWANEPKFKKLKIEEFRLFKDNEKIKLFKMKTKSQQKASELLIESLWSKRKFRSLSLLAFRHLMAERSSYKSIMSCSTLDWVEVFWSSISRWAKKAIFSAKLCGWPLYKM